LALCRASKSRAERSTSRAVGAYLHQQSMPWVSFVRFLVRGRLDGSPSVSYGAVLEV
jgi:predicted YcjX-like family ATPase